MSQEQRDREQPWVLVGGVAGYAADEPVEVITDVQLFEQCMQQPARQPDAVRAFGQRAKVIEASVTLPVVDLAGGSPPGQ